MESKWTTPGRMLLLALAATLGTGLSGCDDTNMETSRYEEPGVPGPGAPGVQVPGAPEGMEPAPVPSEPQIRPTTPAAEAPRSIAVTLQEYDIQMPYALPPGRYVLRIRNTGDVEHSLAIRGEGLAKRLEHPVQPHEATEMHVQFEPGEYYIWCPVTNHEEAGMRMTLLVNEAFQ